MVPLVGRVKDQRPDLQDVGEAVIPQHPAVRLDVQDLPDELGVEPDLDRLEQATKTVWPKPRMLVLNFPQNPTTQVVDLPFFEKIVDFCRENQMMLVHDLAYADIVFDGYKAPSLLQVPGAKEVGVELHSASKSFNMTGWRCGFVAGNELLVKAYGDVKDNSDSGQFLAIQHAAAHGLDHPEITQKIAAKYSRRMGALVKVLNQAGFRARKPKGSFFLYVKAPKAAV